jgi:hypothetical protein
MQKAFRMEGLFGFYQPPIVVLNLFQHPTVQVYNLHSSLSKWSAEINSA